MSTYLKRVSTSSGFLEACPVEFGRSLTCVIGARGTCKSTLIESIRFAFETDPAQVATLVEDGEAGDQKLPTFGIIKATLRAGSVRCELERARQAFQAGGHAGTGSRWPAANLPGWSSRTHAP